MVLIDCGVEKKTKSNSLLHNIYIYYDWLVLQYKEFSKYDRKTLD